MQSIYEIRKATVFKRIAAFIFDALIFVILWSGVFILSESLSVGFKEASQLYTEKCLEHNLSHEVETSDGVKGTQVWVVEEFLKSEYAPTECLIPEDAETNNLEISDSCMQAYENFMKKNNEAFGKDEVAVKAYSDVLLYRLSFFSIATLTSSLILNFALPLIFKNGQTVGKKILHIAVLSNNGIRIKNWQVFARAILGGFAIELMPIMLYLAAPGAFSYALTLAVVVAIVNLFLFMLTKNRTMIHDFIAGSIVINLDTTVVIDSLDERKQRIEEERLARESSSTISYADVKNRTKTWE